jgi:hypothetical protein
VQAYIRGFTVYAQNDWGALLPMCMLAINNKVHSTTGLAPFFTTHGYHVDILQLEDSPRDQRESPRADQGRKLVERLKEATEWAQAAISAAQQRQEEVANRTRDPAEHFKVGDKVWLDLRNVRTPRPSKNLDWLHAKYTVTEVISSHSYRLDVPTGIHPVFHVDLLRRAAIDPFPSQQRDDAQPPAVLIDNNDEWAVEEILQTRTRRRGRGVTREVYVKWNGYAEPTWEPVENLDETEAWGDFLARYGSPWPERY